MALQDLYGIQKGEAQVFNNQPYLDLLAEERATNRKAYAEQVAKKAAKAAAIKAIDDKLEVEGYEKHTKFLQDELYGLKGWLQEQYATHGEDVFTKNPSLAREREKKVDNFVRYNTWSKNLIESAKEQHTRALKDDYDLDIESLKEHNDYWSLSPEEQYTRPMPLIKDRELTGSELITKTHGTAINKFIRKKAYSTTPDATGRFLDVSEEFIDDKDINDLTTNIMTNPDSRVRQRYMSDALQEVLGEGQIGQYIIDANGQKTENPNFMQEVTKRATDAVKSEIINQSPKESTSKKANYAPGYGKDGKEEDESIVEQVDPSEGGVRVQETPDFIKAKNDVVSKGYTDGDGNPYLKLAQDFYKVSVDGVDKYYIKSELTEKQLKGATKIPKNTVIDRNFKPVESKNLKLLNEATQVNKYQTGDTYSVKIPKEYSNLTGMDYIIGVDGKRVNLNLTQGGGGVSIDEMVIDAKYKEIDGKIYFPGNDKYEKSKDKPKTVDFVTIKPKGSKNFVTTPLTKEILNKNPKFASHYKGIKSKKGGEGDAIFK